ncbi:PREDICTED: uncharacterized protein LOC104809251 isoform X2 [Tarenaya hassleriana]|uniref:uncharacterized protein LOC104809251 isoform X2 n=1 Tax=Tarenaya hassleriana TaxID=28532 RepID=UPI00053C66BB|nr:PREDICTED: uncharacterized protein LOC104809251 isoform X2 [Tarenaya hassleriana]
MEADEKELQKLKEEDTYVWDDNTQLYVHHSSGFYHDPTAGWYYSSKDCMYYKYENGEYTPLEFGETRVSSSLDESHRNVASGHVENCSLIGENGSEVQNGVIDTGESSSVSTGCANQKEPDDPPRPSAWVEDTLISLYLAGYNQQPDIPNDAVISSGVDDQNCRELSAYGDDDAEELEEGEWIPEEDFDPHFLMEGEFEEGAVPAFHSTEEEIWQAQYGQVIEFPEKALPELASVDLWDWKMVSESRKGGNGHVVARLVGRLVRRSAKLHPSVASGGKLLKTAPICEAQLHLVRVRTGQVYKLRNPSAEYLASLSVYDSSNPTKDWGFPEISNTWKSSDPKCKAKKKHGNAGFKSSAKSLYQLNAAEERSNAYRDRAAERRNLHGGYGVGPGQKTLALLETDGSELPETDSAEEAAAEALDMSFGSQSYARRIMGNMGWKEGETLGRSAKGLLEPLQAVGNTGNAGLGYPLRRQK